MADKDPLKPEVIGKDTLLGGYVPKKFTKLKSKYEYDHEMAVEYAEAANTLVELMKETNRLKALLEENKKLQRFMWVTAEGKHIPHHAIDDDHMQNIIKHLAATNRVPSKELKAEAESRGMSFDDTYENIARLIRDVHIQDSTSGKGLYRDIQRDYYYDVMMDHLDDGR